MSHTDLKYHTQLTPDSLLDVSFGSHYTTSSPATTPWEVLSILNEHFEFIVRSKTTPSTHSLPPKLQKNRPQSLTSIQSPTIHPESHCQPQSS
jgi:hypothetical protein